MHRQTSHPRASAIGRMRVIAYRLPCRWIGFFFAALGVASAAAAQPLITDDFNDGNDAGWTRVDPRAGTPDAATFSFPGGAYRIQNPADAVGITPVASLRTDATYGDFRVEADIIDWDPNTIPVTGVLARVANATPGHLAGYGLITTLSDFGITRYVNNAQSAIRGSRAFSLIPGHDYRLRFHGSGAAMAGELIDLGTGQTVVDDFARDATYASGFSGLLLSDNGNHLPGDVTFDNYLSTVPEPAAALLLAPAALWLLASRRRTKQE